MLLESLVGKYIVREEPSVLSTLPRVHRLQRQVMEMPRVQLNTALSLARQLRVRQSIRPGRLLNELVVAEAPILLGESTLSFGTIKQILRGGSRITHCSEQIRFRISRWVRASIASPRNCSQCLNRAPRLVTEQPSCVGERFGPCCRSRGRGRLPPTPTPAVRLQAAADWVDWYNVTWNLNASPEL